MAEGGPDRGAASSEDLPFVERVRFMMYGDREKEAFLIEKKEKEEKKKAKKALKEKKRAIKEALKKKEAEKKEESKEQGEATDSPTQPEAEVIAEKNKDSNN